MPARTRSGARLHTDSRTAIMRAACANSHGFLTEQKLRSHHSYEAEDRVCVECGEPAFYRVFRRRADGRRRSVGLCKAHKQSNA